MAFKDSQTRPTPVVKRDRATLSCTECHRRKQKCNRSLPCNDCNERRVPHKCRYEPPVQGLGINQQRDMARRRKPISSVTVVQEFSSESVAELAVMQSAYMNPRNSPTGQGSLSLFQLKLLEDASASIIGLPSRPVLRPPTLGVNVGYGDIPRYLGSLDSFDPFDALPHSRNRVPVQQRPLISYCTEHVKTPERLAPWLSQYEEGLNPTSPRLSWLPESIDYPPLFHATLLCAAVHLDRVQPKANPQVAIWLKAETLGLLNESLSNTGEGASDRTIVVALVLLYFNVGGGNPAEYETHLRGINQMLRVRGGIKALGMRGILKNWLAVCHGPWSKDWEYGYFLKDS